MKVLKPGREQAGWAREFECTGHGNGGGGCGATLLVERADVYATFRSCYDGSTDNYRTFACGACGVETDIPETVSLPFHPPAKKDWQAARARAATPEPRL